MSMTERVARAIAETKADDGEPILSVLSIAMCERAARAAIAAMREPTTTMTLDEWKRAVINDGRCLEDYRDAIVEECARKADEYGSIHGEYIAAKIRALKEKG